MAKSTIFMPCNYSSTKDQVQDPKFSTQCGLCLLWNWLEFVWSMVISFYNKLPQIDASCWLPLAGGHHFFKAEKFGSTITQKTETMCCSENLKKGLASKCVWWRLLDMGIIGLPCSVSWKIRFKWIETWRHQIKKLEWSKLRSTNSIIKTGNKLADSRLKSSISYQGHTKNVIEEAMTNST